MNPIYRDVVHHSSASSKETLPRPFRVISLPKNLEAVLEKLESKYIPNDSVSRFLSRCKSLLIKILHISSSRTGEAYRTQEHLIMGGGSRTDIQLSALKKHLATKTGGGFDRVKKEISRGVLGFGDGLLRGAFPLLGEALWAERVKWKIKHLRQGEALWIEVNSPTHAMAIRIEKNHAGHFDLQMANTGLGIESNVDFHPTRGDLRQVVATLSGISSKDLLGSSFFYKVAMSLEMKGVFSSIKPVNALYEVLRSLRTPVAFPKMQDLGFEQLSGSCTASCLLAMLRASLSPEEFREFELEMQIKALVKHYKALKAGHDQSATRKLMVWDLLQKLKVDLEPTPPIFNKIEQELKRNLKMNAPELKIAKRSRIALEVFSKKKKFPPFEAKLSYFSLARTEFMNLTATLRLKRVNSHVNFEVEGGSVDDKLAVLAFYLANGESEKVESQLQRVMEDVGVFTKGYSEKAYEASKALTHLLEQFVVLDRTRSGMARTRFLSYLTIHLILKRYGAEVKFKGSQIDVSNISLAPQDKEILGRVVNVYLRSEWVYRKLQGNRYLPENNVWVQAYRRFRPLHTIPVGQGMVPTSLVEKSASVLDALHRGVSTEDKINQVITRLPT